MSAIIMSVMLSSSAADVSEVQSSTVSSFMQGVFFAMFVVSIPAVFCMLYVPPLKVLGRSMMPSVRWTPCAECSSPLRA